MRVNVEEKGSARSLDYAVIWIMRFSIAIRSLVSQKNYQRRGSRKLFWMGLVLARLWRGQAGSIASTEKV